MIQLPNNRQGNDFHAVVSLKDAGVAVDWSTLQDIRIFYLAEGQDYAFAGRAEYDIDGETPTLLHTTWKAADQLFLGIHRIVAQVTLAGDTKTYDVRAVNVVPLSDSAQVVYPQDETEIELEVEEVDTSILYAILRACQQATIEAVKGEEERSANEERRIDNEEEREANEVLREAAERQREQEFATYMPLINQKADKDDVYTKEQSDLRVLLVQANEKLHDRGIITLQSLSYVSGVIVVHGEGTIIPSMFTSKAWLYEYEEGWRLTHDLSAFVVTAETTWYDVLDYLDQHSDKIVGSDRFDDLLAQVTALREKTAAITRSGEEGQHQTFISDTWVGIGQNDNPTDDSTLLVTGRSVYLWGVGGYDGGTDTTPLGDVINGHDTEITNLWEKFNSLVVIDEEEV